jgi:hypothetical protein
MSPHSDFHNVGQRRCYAQFRDARVRHEEAQIQALVGLRLARFGAGQVQRPQRLQREQE